jgi:hypothetical protein
MLHLPSWRVEAPRDVTTSKRLFFYLFVFICTGLTTKVLGKGDGGIEWPWGILKLNAAGSVESVGKGVCGVIRFV